MDPSAYVLKAQKGNHEAFVHLIKANEPSMYRVAKSFLKMDAECADVIQETILKAFQGIRALREPAYFKTWLIRILINECQKIQKRSSQVIPMAELVERASQYDTNRDLEIGEAIASLEEDFRIIITLFYTEDLPLKEIAVMLDVPEGTVKSRLYRAREKLAHYLQGREKRGLWHE
ncbi:sigma-70 family RNA polymerase sigma factor [Paenibacillus eucommiae]|uniref:RNA polymerase sigma-70 factor (ECF subfamily) n=1 Tax=Paenibacillus eucommiae TaxID=1355755 RepID=A0ABS4IR58_9BACL|nr:sigma-70 family RNA polymerase sigma factor [Paenibacillus eucommiae]MBP1990054.1 RNA polymerase sigma-70 factor (ECF subfamily) [Paenibacillus eucommiae]